MKYFMMMLVVLMLVLVGSTGCSSQKSEFRGLGSEIGWNSCYGAHPDQEEKKHRISSRCICIAGILSGDIQVIRQGDDIIIAEGCFPGFKYEFLREACAIADSNGDKKVTLEEAREAHRRIMRQYAK